MTITVVIKGTVDEAKKAAAARRVVLSHIREGNHGHAVGTVGDRFAHPVLNWYQDRNKYADEKGYPPGTLTLYRQR